jgi:threonine/homoserine/homoserine lactone efflux protein
LTLPDATTLGLFVTTSLALLIAPGPAVLYIVARSLDQGRTAGLVAAAGMNTGGLVHVCLAAGGLAALAAAAPLFLALVQLAGGLYLAYLGVRTLRTARGSGSDSGSGVSTRTVGYGRIFRESVAVNVLNPKALTFFFAYLPQFSDPRRGGLTGQLLSLGLVFIALAVVTDATYALVSGSAGNWLRARPKVARGMSWISGLVYVGLGIAACVGGVRGLQRL